MSTIYYESNNTLYHHGIKGQKWGVRRFQNKDGTLTSAGRRRSIDNGQKLKDAIDGNFKSAYAEKKLSEKTDKKMARLDRLRDKGLISDYKHYKVSEKIYDKSYDQENKLWVKKINDRNRMYREVFTSAQYKKSTDRLKQIHLETDALRDKYLSYKSDAYKKAFNEYKKNHNTSDAEYGFDHYQWRKGNPSYDKALSEFNNASKKLDAERTQISKSVTDSLVKGYGNLKVKDSGLKYKQEVDNLLYEYSQGHLDDDLTNK